MPRHKKLTKAELDERLALKFRVDTLKQFLETRSSDPESAPVVPVQLGMAAGVIPLILGEEEANKMHEKIFNFFKANDEVYTKKLEKAYTKLSKEMIKRVPDYDTELKLGDEEGPELPKE